MQKLNPETGAFIERMGLLFERIGTSRTFGRLFGLLLVADKPLSLNEMTRLLHVSKASISTNARLCEQIGLAQRVSVPGDRRTYYEMLPGSFGHVFEVRLALIHERVHLAEEGLKAVETDNALALERLNEMRDFYEFIGSEMRAMLARWRAQQGDNR